MDPCTLIGTRLGRNALGPMGSLKVMRICVLLNVLALTTLGSATVDPVKVTGREVFGSFTV